MERLRHLVVIVPGIGGSVLDDGAGKHRWGPRLPGVARGLLSPGNLGLSEHDRLVPVGLMPTIMLIPPFVLPGYDRLVRRIGNAFAGVRVDVARPGQDRDLRADVVLFPYDFRLGIRDAAEHLKAEIDARLGGLTRSARDRRVIVVAHSMGGLVARYWAGPLGGAQDCRALITAGTPHRGAPKALDWLVNGVRAGPISFGAATGVLREWPSAYELLPRYPAVLPTESADDPAQGTATAIYPYALKGVGAKGFADLAGQAFAMHRDIEEAWDTLAAESGGPEVTALFARGHATLGRAMLAGRSLRVTKQDAEWLPNAGWRGDGTVPAISAIPIEAGDDLRSRRAVTERHLKMASAPVIIDVLREYAGESLASVRGDDPDQPWLGLDLDTMVPAGQPVTVGAELLGAQAGEATAVWVSVQPADRKPGRQRVRCSAVGGRWQAVLTGLAAGAYHVAVEAVNVPGVDQVRCKEVIGVVEP